MDDFIEALLEELEEDAGMGDPVENVHERLYRCCLWGYCAAYRMYTGRAQYPFTGSDFGYLLRRGGLLATDEDDRPVFLRDMFAENDPQFVQWLARQAKIKMN